MKTIKLLIASLLILFFTACEEQVEGTIQVQNKVHNVKLESIVWNDMRLAYSLLPGESSDEYVVFDYKENFPKTDILKFYMTSGGNRVYLQTRQEYSLHFNEKLLIIISDSTEVVNPLLE